MKFEYLEYARRPSPAFPHKDKTFRPAVEVLLKYGGKTQKVFAIVDSGADMCAFPAKLGYILGIPIASGICEQLKSIEGGQTTVYYHNLEMELAGYRFTCLAAFGEGIKFPVLGQDGFFDKFEITFNYRKKEITLTPF